MLIVEILCPVKLLFTFHDSNWKCFLNVFMVESIYTTRLEVCGAQNNTDLRQFLRDKRFLSCETSFGLKHDLNLKVSWCGQILSFQLFLNFFCIGQNHSVNQKEQQKLLCTETGGFNKTLWFSRNQISCLNNQTFRRDPNQDHLMKLYKILKKMSENVL